MAETAPQQTTMGPGGVPKGSQTSDYYRTKDIPRRFDNPGGCHIPGNPVFSCQLDIPSKPMEFGGDDWFQGYPTNKPINPMYRTSNNDYGSKAPSVHTMPTMFAGKSQKFSLHLGKCGMPRNHSLNCAVDKSNVPDH